MVTNTVVLLLLDGDVVKVRLVSERTPRPSCCNAGWVHGVRVCTERNPNSFVVTRAKEVVPEETKPTLISLYVLWIVIVIVLLLAAIVVVVSLLLSLIVVIMVLLLVSAFVIGFG